MNARIREERRALGRDNFVRCDDPSTCSGTRTMNKRNTLVGPQLQRGGAGFNPDWKRLIAFVAVIVLGSIVEIRETS